jgi:hypothetical protein
MAEFANQRPESGGIIVVPPDDFYQMPYGWGYYGTDNFVADFFKRPVVIPNRQSYTQMSEQLVRAVNLAGTSMLDADWQEVTRLLQMLRTPFVLVRGDILTPFPNHNIAPPSAFARSLEASQDFVLLHKAGPLELFLLNGQAVPTFHEVAHFATVNSSLPDLGILSMLPSDTAVVSAPPIDGLPRIEEAPTIQAWKRNGTQLTATLQMPSGWSYNLVTLRGGAAGSQSRLDKPIRSDGVLAAPVEDNARTGTTRSARLLIQGKSIIRNGDFGAGLWGSVGDCHNVLGATARDQIAAKIVPQAGPSAVSVLRLSARVDSACEQQWLDWHGGPLILSFVARHNVGYPPRVCIWEVGPSRCANTPNIRDGEGWITYRASVVPDPGTVALGVFLYADSPEHGGQTVNDYANVEALELPSLPHVLLLGMPLASSPSTTHLFVLHAGYSTDWDGPPRTQHVLVDGLLNGWISNSVADAPTVKYKNTSMFAASRLVSVAVGLLIIGLIVFRSIRSRVLSR